MFPWQAVFLFGTGVSVCMGLSAVEDLLEQFVSRLLSFHSHLLTKKEINPYVLPTNCLTAALFTRVPPRPWSVSPSASPLCLSPWSLWCQPTPPSPSRLTWPNHVQKLLFKNDMHRILHLHCREKPGKIMKNPVAFFQASEGHETLYNHRKFWINHEIYCTDG